jgi:hypothetical protein
MPRNIAIETLKMAGFGVGGKANMVPTGIRAKIVEIRRPLNPAAVRF